jgi:hypothetical protein
MKRLYTFSGLFSMIVGSFLIFMAYGFATLAFPDARGWADQMDILHAMLTDGPGAAGIGVFLIGVGAWLAFSKPKP